MVDRDVLCGSCTEQHTTGGWALPEKWDTDMFNPEDLLFMLSWLFARPPFQHFSVLKTLLFIQKLQFFLEMLCSKALKFAENLQNFQFLSLKFVQT